MKSFGLVLLGVVGGVLAGVWLARTGGSDCCEKLAQEVDKKAGGTGAVAAGLDALGLSSHLPGILDAIGQ